MADPIVPELLTTEEAAAYLGISEKAIRRLAIERVVIPGRGKKPRTVRYRRAALNAWILDHAVEPTLTPHERAERARRSA